MKGFVGIGEQLPLLRHLLCQLHTYIPSPGRPLIHKAETVFQERQLF